MAMGTKETMQPIPDSTAEIEKSMKEKAGLTVSFDLGVHKLTVLKKEVQIYYTNGLVNTAFTIELMEGIVALNETERSAYKLYDTVRNRIVNQQVREVESLDEMVDNILTGQIAIVIDGVGKAIIVDVREYPARSPEEPDTEKITRGSRDGFTETIVVNTALTRRRIRDERLRFEGMQVGVRSKTDIAIGYIKGIADPGLVDVVRKEIKNIEIDGLTMAEKTVEEFMVKQGYNPYPLVRYTERPDVAATHLLEGHVIIYVDTSPSVMIAPATLFHHLQHAEEYRQSPAVGTLVRWVRFLGVFASVFLLPLWLLLAIDPSLLPEVLNFIGPNKHTNIPIALQIFLADFGVEFLRMAAIHTPTPLSTAMGLVAAVLIGEIAINVGLFVPEVILYVAIAAIGTYATPSLELSLANKIARVFLLLTTFFFHVPGFVIGTTVYILFLARIKAVNTPYLWPLLPLYPKALMQLLVRRTVPGSNIRPSIVHPRDRYRQPPEQKH